MLSAQEAYKKCQDWCQHHSANWQYESGVYPVEWLEDASEDMFRVWDSRVLEIRHCVDEDTGEETYRAWDATWVGNAVLLDGVRENFLESLQPEMN